MTDRLFPLLHGRMLKSVPWSLLAPHEKQAQKNHGQTLERLAQRCGLSACEALAVIEGRAWTDISDGDAESALAKLVVAHKEPDHG